MAKYARNATVISWAAVVVLVSACPLSTRAEEPGAAAESDIFDRDVRSVLSRHCVECHAGESPEMDLNVATAAGVLAGSETGAVVVPGKAAESLLLQVLAADSEPHMPPEEQLTGDEIAAISAWIDSLAAETPVGRPKISTDDRGHWSFQPLNRPPIPDVPGDDWSRTPIDRFIAARLADANLSPGPPADKATLMRRLYFDLIGLPPVPEEVVAFENDRSPDAYERIVDRLLASPRYGERWGRHWLDLARYADSSGFHNDLDRPGAWYYRDYVIASFNSDKPYGQFVREQLAGDQLPDASLETWIATGFARTGPSNEDNMGMGIARQQYRLDELDGVLSTTSNVFLGLTIGCARCHDHKYDPLPQRDYYRFLAYFDSAEKRQLDVASFQPDSPKLTPVGDQAQAAPGALVLTDRGTLPRTTRVLYRGDVRSGGPVVQAGTPEVLANAVAVDESDSGQHSSSSRLALADWIADPANPLTWRVMANRVWHYHFGRGMVATPSNFGRLGQRPTHPELLDWLADRLRSDGSLKSLHRLIVTSAVYRQSSQSHAAGQAADPDNLWLWRMPRRRLEAEPLRDAFLSVGGNLNLAMGGPGVKPRIRPDLLVASQRNKWPLVEREGPDHWRRSVYVYVKRQLQLPMLELFDAPATTHSCPSRDESLVPTQALVLMNDEFVREQAGRFADRAARDAGDDLRSQVERAMWIALSGPPTEERVDQAAAFLAAQTARLAVDGQSVSDARRNALADLCHVLMNLSEFVYVD